jgi:hypothetical protein
LIGRSISRPLTRTRRFGTSISTANAHDVLVLGSGPARCLT